jgi:tRNA(Ile2) C34 agmatinyltransferase TiaS
MKPSLKIRLNRIFTVHLVGAWREWTGACWACGTPWWSEGYKGSGMVCNYCNKKIKIK